MVYNEHFGGRPCLSCFMLAISKVGLILHFLVFLLLYSSSLIMYLPPGTFQLILKTEIGRNKKVWELLSQKVDEQRKKCQWASLCCCNNWGEQRPWQDWQLVLVIYVYKSASQGQRYWIFTKARPFFLKKKGRGHTVFLQSFSPSLLPSPPYLEFYCLTENQCL